MCTQKKLNFLSPFDLNREQLLEIYRLTDTLIQQQATNKDFFPLKGKVVGLLFQYPSFRTRLSFEVAANRLGAYPVYLRGSEVGFGERESLKDIAQVISGYIDLLIIRAHYHNDIEQFSKFSSIPIINGLSDMYHPTQVLCDIYTIYKKKGKVEGIEFVYIGDGQNNIANCWLILGPLVGMNVTIVTAKEFMPQAWLYERAQSIAKDTHSKLIITDDHTDAVKKADVIYTDVWVSMSDTESIAQRKRNALKNYQINSELLRSAKSDFVLMHCLPAHRGEEITDEVLDGPHSIVLEQAYNKVAVGQALLVYMLSNPNS